MEPASDERHGAGAAAIGWIREVVMDCPEPWALARFWAGLLGGSPVEWYPGWVTIQPPPHGQRLSFQASAAPPGTGTARACRGGCRFVDLSC